MGHAFCWIGIETIYRVQNRGWDHATYLTELMEGRAKIIGQIPKL